MIAGALLLLSLPWNAAAATEALPAPKTTPILVVGGAIAVANQDGRAVLDLGLKRDVYFSRCVWQLSGLTEQ